MVTLALGCIAVLSLVGVVLLWLRVNELAAKVRNLRNAPRPHAPAALALAERSPLEGMKVTLAIAQDLERPVFASLLRERLLREDVSEVSLSADVSPEVPEGGLMIKGNLVCNGYAEIYYSADLTCVSATGTVVTLSERPPHGDRPINLVNDLAARLVREIQTDSTRWERQSALRELTDL